MKALDLCSWLDANRSNSLRYCEDEQQRQERKDKLSCSADCEADHLGLFAELVCKARAKMQSISANLDLAGKTAIERKTVTPPEQPGCATLEQVVTIGTALAARAHPP